MGVNIQWISLPDVVFFQEGPGVRNTQYVDKGIKLLNVANLQDGEVDLSTSDRFISDEEAYGKYKHFLVDEGDLIIASSGIKVEYFHKKMGFIKKEHLPLCLNTSTIRFKTLDENKLDIRYFMYFLKSVHFKMQLSKLITGSAQLNFGPSHLKQMKVPMLPLENQKHIVQILDKTNNLINKRQSQITALDELTQSLFLEMFGDPVVNPKNILTKKLGDTGELKRGMSKHRPRNAPELLGGPYPLIQTGDVSKAGLFIEEYKSTYSEMGLKQSKMWESGTLCITIAANIAETSILKFDACFPDSVVGYKPHEQMNTIFVHYWFSFLQKIIERNAPESAQKNINLKILNDLKILQPPIEKQVEFANKVLAINKQKTRLLKAKNSMEDLYEAILQKAFKSELFQEQ